MAHINQDCSSQQSGGAGLLSAWGEDINRELDAAVTQTRALLGSFYFNMQDQRAAPTPLPPSISPPLPSSVDMHLELFGKAKAVDSTAALPKRRRSAEPDHHRHNQVRIELPHAMDSTRGAQWVATHSLLPHNKRHANGPKSIQLQLDYNKSPQSTVLTPGACTPNTASKIAMWMKNEPLKWGQSKPASPLHVKVTALPPPAAAKQAAGRKGPRRPRTSEHRDSSGAARHHILTPHPPPPKPYSLKTPAPVQPRQPREMRI
ncbi:hypothetical protein T484DRAFT_3632034 [Baffinella frigidus]|nr:hypothetical protein T484DRAFT_3632034 [Cryptophyta sp. CCMP2293]